MGGGLRCPPPPEASCAITSGYVLVCSPPLTPPSTLRFTCRCTFTNAEAPGCLAPRQFFLQPPVNRALSEDILRRRRNPDGVRKSRRPSGNLDGRPRNLDALKKSRRGPRNLDALEKSRRGPRNLDTVKLTAVYTTVQPARDFSVPVEISWPRRDFSSASRFLGFRRDFLTVVEIS